jgi:cytochrome c551/c552
MRAWILAAVIIAMAPLARAQSGEALLESKGCLGCHGVDEKKMGPALREAAAKYKGSEGKLIAALRAGQGHPMKVEASEAELKTILAFLQTAAAKPKAAA